MKRFFAAIACGITLLVISIAGSDADPESCQLAMDQYRSAKSDVTDALGRLASCIADTDAHEDCHREFVLLGFKQEDFESTVAVIMRKRALAYHLDGLFSGHYESKCPQ